MPDLGAAGFSPRQLAVQAGDCVLLHSATAHSAGPNEGSEIRAMVYFRLQARGFRELQAGGALNRDMWADLPGLAPYLSAAPT